MAKRGRPRKKRINVKSRETSIVLGLISIILAGLIVISLFVDAPGFFVFKQYLGLSAVIASIFFANLGLRYFGIDNQVNTKISLFFQLVLVFVLAGFIHIFVQPEEALHIASNGGSGGLIGFWISDYLINIFSKEGAIFILLVLLIASVTLALQLSLKWIIEIVGKTLNIIKDVLIVIFSYLGKMLEGLNRQKNIHDATKDNSDLLTAQKSEKEKKMVGDLHKDFATTTEQKDKEKIKTGPVFGDPVKGKSTQDLSSPPNVKIETTVTEGAVINDGLAYPKWKLPPIDLLDPYSKQEGSDENIRKNADIIEETLDNFGIQARVVEINVGPRVTQYALNIALGTPVKKITSHKTDLALALAAPSGGIRLEAPIPGTSFIGIEVPNSKGQIIQIKEVMETLLAKQEHHLGVVVGKDIGGHNVTTDLQKMPHLLIAGATGSGKSVVTNSFIISLLMTKTPDEIKFILIDPKQVELSFYNGIPHLLTPVITEMDKVPNALKWAAAEMERRYTLFRQAKVKNIEGYNQLMGFTAIPYIVVLIDEVGDLILKKGKEVEDPIVILAQKARATGIHLVLATQRPTVNVITGLIKANFPGRVALRVPTQTDSRVILDIIGAETLLGRGDMLFKFPDISKPARIQGVWVSEEEITKVVDFIQNQISEVQYSTEITSSIEAGGEQGDSNDFSDFSDDELFGDAVSVVIRQRKASASMLQRKLKVGYNRAARLMDEMYEAGIIGPPDGSKPRDILISDINSLLKKDDETSSSQEGEEFNPTGDQTL